jgi:hypothetical protein
VGYLSRRRATSGSNSLQENRGKGGAEPSGFELGWPIPCGA